MVYKAVIMRVEKSNDEVMVEIEFTDGESSFTKKYPFVHVNDLETVFNNTIQSELKRISDLETGYITLTARVNEEISLTEVK